MLSVVEKNEDIAVVIVHKLDRFARNSDDSHIYKKQLEDLGIELWSTTEKITNDFSGRMMFALKSIINEDFSRNLSE